MDFHAVADDLQSLLVEVIDLSLISKQAHWIHGRPLFELLSAELDDLAPDAWGCADAVGARLVGMGIPHDGRPGSVAEQIRFASFPVGFIDDAEAVAAIVVRLNEIIEACPRRIEVSERFGPGQRRSPHQESGGLVKHRWMLASRESGDSSPLDVAARRPRTVRG